MPSGFKLLLAAASPLTNLRLAVAIPGAEPHSQPYQFPFTRNEVFDNYTVYPFRTIGRLYATEPNGRVGVCSAAAVNSPNRRLIVTAAHCIRDGYGNNYSNIRFYPGFQDGATPYGLWRACDVLTAAAYVNNTQDGNFAHDIGAVVTCDQITPDGFVL